jgi:hypothetical protein
MIVDKNNVLTREGETKVPFFAVICGSIHVLIWIKVKVEHKSSFLKKSMWILKQIYDHWKYVKQSMKIVLNTIIFGYVFICRKKVEECN